LLEQSKLESGVGDADLFRDRFFARVARAVEQISSWLCSLSALFAVLPRQTRVRVFLPRGRSGSCRNSDIVFSFAKRTIAMSDMVTKQIQALIDRETLGLNNKNPGLFLDFIHPDMVWPWPPTPGDHDPVHWRFVLGRFNKERWRQ